MDKHFIPGITLTNLGKTRFLSNTHCDDVRRIMDAFGDTFLGEPRAIKGATAEELSAAGIVGVYEAL